MATPPPSQGSRPSNPQTPAAPSCADRARINPPSSVAAHTQVLEPSGEQPVLPALVGLSASFLANPSRSSMCAALLCIIPFYSLTRSPWITSSPPPVCGSRPASSQTPLAPLHTTLLCFV
eukprot:4578379-Pyramimonas_sp.AAC.1